MSNGSGVNDAERDFNVFMGMMTRGTRATGSIVNERPQLETAPSYTGSPTIENLKHIALRK